MIDPLNWNLAPSFELIWGLFRLFECIGAMRGWKQMKKGSPRDYDAETGCFEQSAQKSQLGEPHECYSLYRIRRTQENHQLLHQDGRRPNRAAGQIGGIARSASSLGRGPGRGMEPWKRPCSVPGSTTHSNPMPRNW